MKIIKFLVVLILFVITYYSLKTPDGHDLPTNDKVGHALAYLTLSFHLALLCSKQKQIATGILFAISYGLLMEYFQGFIPGRTPSMYDMIANSTGVLLGFGIVFFLKPTILKIYRFLRII